MPDFTALKALKDEVCQSAMFSEEGFAELVKQAIELLKQGGYYETCVSAYRMLLPVYQEAEDYKKQLECHKELYSICQILVDETQLNQRIFSNYYRVAFYGTKFGPDIHDKEFIYKELNTVRVADFTERLKVRQSFHNPNFACLLVNLRQMDFDKHISKFTFSPSICRNNLAQS